MIVLAVVAISAAPAAVPQPADMSGTWVATKDAPAGIPAAPIATFGERFAVRQSGDTFAVIRPGRETSVMTSVVLDGREVRSRVPGGLCQGDSVTIEVGAREGEAVVHRIVGSIAPGGGPVVKRDIRRVFRLQSPDTLVVESRTAIEGEMRPVATIYKRSTETIPEPAAAAAAKAPGTIAQVGWISGVWIGVNGVTTEERWTPVAGGSMIGVGRTLRGTAMAAFEFLCIAERGGSLVYSAMPGGRSPATHFTATAVTADSVTFENPAHDYPKLIRYTKRADGSLETTISGEGGQRAQSVVLKREEK
jgi:hypothetical protein